MQDWYQNLVTRATRSWLFAALAVGTGVRLAAAAEFVIADPDGALSRAKAPVAAALSLAKSQIAAARSGRLAFVDRSARRADRVPIPTQWEWDETTANARAVWLMPPGTAGERRFALRKVEDPQPAVMLADRVPANGQLELREQGRPILRYNYQTVEPGDVFQKVSEGNRIYARARSDYIHPLHGPTGEVLTQDWSLDHPHHRGIYWAWPEVDFEGERGDLHALQRVFARPTGKVTLQSGPVFAQVEAENVWRWEDREPIVREVTRIRAYRAVAGGRVVDLTFHFVALRDGVSIARRDTRLYGGLNVRLATPQEQAIRVHNDPLGIVPRRSWSDLSGRFGRDGYSGLTILQHRENPEYPGDWIQYPELSWCQPTFPTAGTRYPLRRGQPLALRYRLWVHTDGRSAPEVASWLWDAFHAPGSCSP